MPTPVSPECKNVTNLSCEEWKEAKTRGQILSSGKHTDDNVLEQIRVGRHIAEQKVRLSKRPEMKPMRIKMFRLRNEQRTMTAARKATPQRRKGRETPALSLSLIHSQMARELEATRHKPAQWLRFWPDVLAVLWEICDRMWLRRRHSAHCSSSMRWNVQTQEACRVVRVGGLVEVVWGLQAATT